MQQSSSGVRNLGEHAVQPVYSLIDFLLVGCVLVTRRVAAERAAVLTQSADFASQISPINREEPLQIPTEDCAALARVMFFQIGTNSSLLVHSMCGTGGANATIAHRASFLSFIDFA